MNPASIALLGLALATCAVGARAAGLYECADTQGRRWYGYEACANGAAALAIDRASPAASVEIGEARPIRSEPAPHRLTQQERERIARLRRDERDAPSQRQMAYEIEIAAIREGADAKVSAADRANLEDLRRDLGSSDPRLRDEALARWQAIYARYREPARPHVQPAPPPLGPRPEVTVGNAPSSPLTHPAPGTQGPLVATPNVQPSGIVRPPTVADPANGRVLAPAGNDRVVDPLTGTMWMRSGRVYVDPSTGRVIPAP